MKIAITGHTNGIGRAIYDKLKEEHSVVGFSPANGYNISNERSRNSIVEQAKNFDVFINNAFHKTGQTILLQEFIKIWNNCRGKLIVHISSKLILMELKIDKNIRGAESQGVKVKDYVKSKQEQQQIILESRKSQGPSVSNISPGPVNTELGSILTCKKLDPNDVANAVLFCIDNKDTMLLEEITVDVPNQPWSEISFK